MNCDHKTDPQEELRRYRRKWIGTLAFGVLVLFATIQGNRLRKATIARNKEAARSLFLNAVVDNLGSGVVVVEASSAGKIVEWNAGAEAITGWTRADAIGQSIHSLMPVRDRERHMQYLGDHRVRDGLSVAPIVVDCWVISKRREYLPVHVRVLVSKTLPPWYLITFDRLDALTRLPAEQMPDDDPRAIQTFSR